MNQITTSSLIDLITIGASAGGIVALKRLFPMLSKTMQIPILVILHIPEDFSVDFESIFKNYTDYKICEITDKMPIELKTMYFAPPAYHVLVEKNKTFSLTQDTPVHFSRPAIDVSFDSASEVLKSNLCGILLTGGNSDGALGLKRIHKYKGTTIVEDPTTALSPYMPQSAIDLFKPDFVGDISQISNFLNKLDLGRGT